MCFRLRLSLTLWHSRLKVTQSRCHKDKRRQALLLVKIVNRRVAMDPVSLCASILAIITAAQSGVQGLRKIKQCWKAPQEIEDLVIEIESLQSILSDVVAFVERTKSILYSESLSQPTLHASSILDSIVTLITSPAFRVAHLSNANHARLIWLRHRGAIKGLLEDLKVVRLDLSLKLGLVVAYAP